MGRCLVVSLWDINNFASTFFCQSHGWHFANRPRSWNHSFLNLLESAVTIVQQKSAFSVSIRPFIRSVGSPHRGALRASIAAPSYWSCPTGSFCEKSAWIRGSECHSGQRFPISTGLELEQGSSDFKGVGFQGYGIKSFCESSCGHCLLNQLCTQEVTLLKLTDRIFGIYTCSLFAF